MAECAYFRHSTNAAGVRLRVNFPQRSLAFRGRPRAHDHESAKYLVTFLEQLFQKGLTRVLQHSDCLHQRQRPFRFLHVQRFY